jgi:hypothetical protein
VLDFFGGDEELLELGEELVEGGVGLRLVEGLNPGEGVVCEVHGVLRLEVALLVFGGGGLGEKRGFVVELLGDLGADAIVVLEIVLLELVVGLDWNVLERWWSAGGGGGGP